MDNQICYKSTITKLHWTAIIAGAFVGVGLSFLLHIFSMAIGLSAYTSSNGAAPAVAIGGIIGLLIGTIASMGAAGYVAGYLGRFYHCYCHGGVIYGFITWSLVLMLNAMLIMPMIHYVAFYEETLYPIVTQTTTSSADTKMAASPNEPAQKTMDINPKELAWNGWILFILFFLGGISSCISACYGMRCEKEEPVKSPPL